MTNTPTAVIYARISRDRTGEGLGVERQLADCRSLATAQGLAIVGEYVDDDTSAYKGKKRKHYTACCETLRGGGASHLLTWHPDRLTRHPRELEDLIDLLESTNTTVRTCQAGDYDLSTPTGRMAARIVGAVARQESEHKAERIKRKKLELAERQMWAGGQRPFGLALGREFCEAAGLNSGDQVPAEAQAIRTGAKMILEGQTCRAVMRAWNDAGIMTTRGNRWGAAPVAQTLMTPYVAGFRVHKGEIFGSASWAPILDSETYENVKAILTNPSRMTTARSAPRKHLLVGLLYCASCGRMMTSGRSNGKHAYQCHQRDFGHFCNQPVSIVGPATDDAIRDYCISRIVDSPAVVPTAAPKELAELVGEVAALRSRLERLEDAFVEGTIAKPRYLKLHEGLAGLLSDAESRLSDLRASTRRLDLPRDKAALEALWLVETLEWKRAVVEATVTRIAIHRAEPGLHKWDPLRIDPTPR